MAADRSDKSGVLFGLRKGSLLYRLFTGHSGEEDRGVEIDSRETEARRRDGEGATAAQGAPTQGDLVQGDLAQDVPVQPRGVRIPQNSLLYRMWGDWEALLPDEGDRLLEEFCDDANAPLAEILPQKELDLEKIRLKTELQKVAQKRSSTTTIALSKGETGALDAEPVLHISKNRLVAWLYVFAPVGGGAELTWESLEKFMSTTEISNGIDQELLRRLVADRLYFRMLRIAVGVPPVPQKDGWIEPRISLEEDTGSGDDELGSIDFKAITRLHVVKKDEVICRIYLPMGGEVGTDVLGHEISFAKGKLAKVPKGSNTGLNQELDELRALVDGQLLLEGGNYQVRPSLVIAHNIDFSTGHIDFLGDVRIGGDILAGFSVHATGSITVGGTIESASVEAGGDIIVGKGVLGDQKAVLRSKRSVKAKYIENCSIYAGECVYSGTIISSRIFCNDKVVVTSGHGTIIGGSIAAANRIEAKIIGSQAFSATDLQLGVFPQASQERQAMLAALKELGNELEKIDKSLETPQNLTPEENGKLRLKRATLLIRKGAMEKKAQELINSNVPDPCACRVVCGLVHPGTQITIGGVTQAVEQTTRGCNAHLVQQTLTISLV